MQNIETLIKDLPGSENAKRFYDELSRKSPAYAKKLAKNDALLSDILTLSAFSPLLATNILQNPQYISWLKKQRISTSVREKDELLESLARFDLTNSQVETNVMLSRFRKRELIRIYLKDIRGLGTIAEITEEISNLADAILEFALSKSTQELDNRYGTPLEVDDKNKSRRARFCVVALGKLGSKELNYSSDIDLLFLYSSDGSTSGHGSKGETSNREYFVKLAEFVSKLVGQQMGGEGAAYRVDLRLRPHGRVGALAVSLREAKNYYQKSARMWEKQVLIRSRASAGDAGLFHEFFEAVKSNVFSKELAVEKALENVRLSKEKINLGRTAKNGFDVKLGKGGIREIEFIAQALQLAYGGNDEWLRSPHTLISLSRLADRKLITESDLTKLFEAYDFLRRLEHRLQMENGLQTHFVTDDLVKRIVISQRMGIFIVEEFNVELEIQTGNVHKIFTRIFGKDFARISRQKKESAQIKTENKSEEKGDIKPLLSSIEKSEIDDDLSEEVLFILKTFSEISPPFSEMLTANPKLINGLPKLTDELSEKNYFSEIIEKILKCETFADSLGALRKTWARIILNIAFFDVFEKSDLKKTRTLQTKLAEASIENALFIVKQVLERQFNTKISEFPVAVLGLGKLGGGGMDYGSDIDLVLVYDDEKPCPVNDLDRRIFYAKAFEIFVTTLSSLTRDGSLYRVDLRLRPDGKNGATSIGKTALFNYLEDRSAIWEWLAYVKLRGVAGEKELASFTENKARKIIHKNAQESEISDSNYRKLRGETRSIRQKLEKSKSTSRKGKEIDIKFGEGGLQDIYFTIRFLQLKDNVPDDPENRSTLFSLQRLLTNGSITKEHFDSLSGGYKFLSDLDHNLRLCVGRSTRLPVANQKALTIIAKRMQLESVIGLLEHLTSHRLNINSSFEAILKN